MKKNLTFLFLLTAFYVTPIFAQEKTGLVTKIIEFKNIKIPVEKKEIFLSSFLKPLLSKNGIVLFNKQDRGITFTDTPNRIKLSKDFMEMLDISGFKANDLSAKSNKSRKDVYEFVETHYIFPALWCDVGEELHIAQIGLQERPLIKIIEGINVKVEKNPNGLRLTGTKKQVALAKKIIAIFDQPILTEEKDF
jgi:type II secretory pathway component GspD/PulD (secretin)